MECILTKQKGQTLAAHHTMSRQGFSVGKKGIMTENREQKGMEALTLKVIRLGFFQFPNFVGDKNADMCNIN